MTVLAQFRREYAAQRAAEGRAHDAAERLVLPYLASGPFARQWAVRARTFDAFVRLVLFPVAGRLHRPVRLLDLGAGNGWLCWRAALAGCAAIAVDLRDDTVDGLGAAAPYLDGRPRFDRLAASFEQLPIAAEQFDLVTFNASLHYALDLRRTLKEARRVTRSGGRIVILDSPFYAHEADGDAMVAEKRRDASRRFGDRAEVLLSPPFIEFLTRERLTSASAELYLDWRRHRVRYPAWYEVRPLVAFARRRRVPSRFDLWECTVQ